MLSGFSSLHSHIVVDRGSFVLAWGSADFAEGKVLNLRYALLVCEIMPSGAIMHFFFSPHVFS
jgi:hypothetical protein